MASQPFRDPTDATAQGDGLRTPPPSDAVRLVERSVLLAVESALELPSDERRGYIDRCPSLDDEHRARALMLLTECERVEQADAARTVAAANGAVAEPEFLAIDLASLLAREDEASGEHRRLSNGANLGPYRIERFIAAGGMGEVYEAVDPRIGRRVAIKTLPLAGSAERAQRFMREAMLMARLEHPAIARMYEWGSSDASERSPPFIAMEFIEGRPLRDAAAAIRTNADGPNAVVRLLLPVVDAVAHAHARGVLHRDIKPGNILVDAAGMARLLDFGVAALIESDAQVALTLTEGATPGTLTYMSPEHVRGGSARVTTRSDVYGLGLVLYEVLAGRPAVETGNRGIAEVIDAVVRTDPRPLRELVPGIGTDLDFVVRKALRKEPSARYASADALAEDLRRVLAGDAPLGRDVGTLEAIRSLAHRNRRGIAIACAVLAGTGVALAFGAVQFVRAREAEARADVIVGQLLEGSKPILLDLHARLLAENQPLAARRAALEATVAYLEWVQANSQDDARVLAEVARRYRALASVAGSTGEASLGDSASATQYYLRSLALLDGLLAGADGTGGGRTVGAELRSQLHIDRSNVLRDYAGQLELGERAAYFERAARDQRAALELMTDGEERDRVERFLLFTQVQAARLAESKSAIEVPLERMRAMATEPRFAMKAEFLSELGLAEYFSMQVLELAGEFDGALARARASKAALERSMELGQDDFTNNRHLARVELVVASLTADERSPIDSLELLLAALSRSRLATNLKPEGSFHRLSHLEAIVQFAGAAKRVATHARDAGDDEGAHTVVVRALAAVEEDFAYTQALPTEGVLHRGEPKLCAEVTAARDALAGTLNAAR